MIWKYLAYGLYVVALALTSVAVADVVFNTTAAVDRIFWYCGGAWGALWIGDSFTDKYNEFLLEAAILDHKEFAGETRFEELVEETTTDVSSENPS